MRVLLASVEDVADVKSWSGTPFHIHRGLLDAGIDVVTASPLRERFGLPLKAAQFARNAPRRPLLFPPARTGDPRRLRGTDPRGGRAAPARSGARTQHDAGGPAAARRPRRDVDGRHLRRAGRLLPDLHGSVPAVPAARACDGAGGAASGSRWRSTPPSGRRRQPWSPTASRRSGWPSCPTGRTSPIPAHAAGTPGRHLPAPARRTRVGAQGHRPARSRPRNCSVPVACPRRWTSSAARRPPGWTCRRT